MIPLKDNVVGLYLKRFVIPGALVFNKPGFVDFKISGKTSIYARQIFYPEDFFVEFQSKIIEEFGYEGRKVLYRAGKKFGYRFAQSGKFENIKDNPGDKIKEWVFINSKFIEGTYANSIENITDPTIPKTEYFLKKFVIIEKLGFDYIFAVGGTAGMMAWMFQDPTVEVLISDLKLVDGLYEATIQVAPYKYLKENFPSKELHSVSEVNGLEEDFQDYIRFNAQAQTSCTKSFQTYLDFKFFNYSGGIVSYKDKRFFMFEVSGTYLLELELKKEKNSRYSEILFESSFKAGEEILSTFGSNPKDVFDVLSAVGWGEVLLFSSNEKEIKVLINHFPWSKWFKEVDFLIMRGFLSGLFTKLKGKKVLFEKPVMDLNEGHLKLLFGGKYV